jgi:hypothetical protein
MKDDPIVEEVRGAREAHAIRFNYDLQAIFADIKEQERQSGRRYASFPAKRLRPAEAKDSTSRD